VDQLQSKGLVLGMEHTIGTGMTSGEWTNSDGEAHFDVKPGRDKVYVDGSKRHEGHLSGAFVVYIQRVAEQLI
jgi:hypothetical protein